MYRRYQSNPVRRTVKAPAMHQHPAKPPMLPKPPPQPPKTSVPPPKSQKPHPNPLMGWIPTSLYNPETKKVLGVFSAEDLLLAGLIFLLLENEEKQDDMLIYALLYILISDYLS